MTKQKLSAVMLILWVTAPLMVTAYAYLPSQSHLNIPKQINTKPDPGNALFRSHPGVQGTSWKGLSSVTDPKVVAPLQRHSKWKKLFSLRRQMREARKNMRDMEDYERSSLIWGAAALFAAVFFIIVGGLLESLIVFGALLAIPFGIIALINHGKARKMGSKRWGGLFMAILAMTIVAFISVAVLILAW